MLSKKSFNSLKVLMILSYAAMIVVNYLTIALPLNGISTKDVAYSYPNLFTPAPMTFSIWGIIYMLLTAGLIYFCFILKLDKTTIEPRYIKTYAYGFIATSILNATWLVLWQYFIIIPATIIISLFLIALIITNLSLLKADFKPVDKFLLRMPMQVYLGWLTVATIANITALFVHLKWNRFGLSESFWTIVVLIVGLLIASATILRLKSLAYGLVIIWAYFGILNIHISKIGFNSEYTGIIITVSICLAVLALVEVYNVILSLRHKNSI